VVRDATRVLVSIRRARVNGRLGSVFAYFLVGLAFHHAEWTALNAYDAVCTEQERVNWLVVPVGADAVKEILFGTLLMSAPALIARSECIIKINFFMASTVVLAAILLSFSAATPPYECVTMGGDYEDHVSGLLLFSLYCLLVLSLSSVFSLVDLLVWFFRQLARVARRIRRDPTTS
jgi:hypothetical protein